MIKFKQKKEVIYTVYVSRPRNGPEKIATVQKASTAIDFITDLYLEDPCYLKNKNVYITNNIGCVVFKVEVFTMDKGVVVFNK